MSLVQTIVPDARLVELANRHRPTLQAAIQAMHKREFYTQYPEMPKAYGEAADAEGKAAFQNQLGQKFERLRQHHDIWLEADETSPYTLQTLGISYPANSNHEVYVAKAKSAMATWRKVPAETRAAVLIESLERMKASFFEIAYATLHGTGQAFMMSFQASGPHAADRALEAIALGYEEQTRFADRVRWTKPMGKFDAVIEKYYVAVPKGVTLNVGCSTFPVWNSLPGLYAALITGNAVIQKPHPMGIYSIAIVVAAIQQTMQDFGLEPEIVQLAPDTAQHPVTLLLAEHPDVKVIDYTGSSAFGSVLESLPGKTTFTEKSGVNSVIIDSVSDLGKVAQNLGFSVSLYSGQMCTAPQNFFIPRAGVQGPEGLIPYESVVEALVGAVRGLAGHEKAGPAVCGAIQNPATIERIAKAKAAGRVLLEDFKIINPEFPEARTSSPAVVEILADQPELFEQELFGPIVLVIPTDSTEHSVQLAKAMALRHGAISCAAYSVNLETQAIIADQMAEAYVPTCFNLMGQVFVNQNAAFSDPHVSGGNPAGNASFTNPEFIAKRFTVVGFKVEGN